MNIVINEIKSEDILLDSWLTSKSLKSKDCCRFRSGFLVEKNNFWNDNIIFIENNRDKTVYKATVYPKAPKTALEFLKLYCNLKKIDLDKVELTFLD